MSTRKKMAVGAVIVAAAVAALGFILLRPDRPREERPGAGPSEPARARPGNEIAWGEAVNGLEVGLSAERAAFAVGEPVELRIGFRNKGPTPLEIDLGGATHWTHLWRVEFHPEGRRKPIVPRYDGPLPSALLWRVELAPGEEQISKKVWKIGGERFGVEPPPKSFFEEAPRFSDRLRPGRYTVTAHPQAVRVFRGETQLAGAPVSGRIEIEIVEEGAR